MTRDEILAALDTERQRQRGQWGGTHAWGRGDCSSPGVPMLVKAAVLAEESGEVLQAVLDMGPDVINDHVQDEVVQTLAVAYAILEGM